MKCLPLVAMATLTLTACASAKVPAPQVALPRQFEADRGKDAAQTSLTDRWWELFDDPQLASLVADALIAAPDARAALARIREAEAIRRSALTSYNPQGNLSTSAARQDTKIGGLTASQSQLLGAGVSESLSGGMNVSWEVDLFGRRAAARQSADADLAAARFNADASRLSLIASVATQLFTARGQAAQVREAEETLRIARELVRIARLRVKAGLNTEADLARLETSEGNAEADLTNFQAQYQTTRRSLLVLLGRGSQPSESLVIDSRLTAAPIPPALMPGDVMEQRPDVREADAKLRSAIGQLRLNRLALFPRLTLQPGVALTRLLPPASYTQTVWTLAAGLTAPILDRARLLAQLGAQNARAEQATIEYERVVQAAYGDAENCLTRLAASQNRLKQLQFAEERASYAFNAQQRGYQAGVIELDALLQTEQAWRSARISLITARTTALTDAVASFKALGGGWTPSPRKEA